MTALARPLPAHLRSVPGDLRSADRHALDTAAISCLPSRRHEECDAGQRGFRSRSASVLQGQTDTADAIHRSRLFFSSCRT
jgi:hypothetical protein